MIYIKPFHYSGRLAGFSKEELASDWLWKNREYLFFNGGKKAIHYLVTSLGIQRADEICILSSTESNYVSTCVSATIFNYSAISRVLTDRTKLIYVIHEFGLPHPDIERIAAIAKEKNIPLAEDCAHSVGVTIAGKMIGMFGDYTIYSLSKHLPMETGGLLTGKKLFGTKNENFNQELNDQVRKQYTELVGYLPKLSKKRVENFELLKSLMPEARLAFNYPQGSIPYLMVLETENYEALYKKTAGLIEAHPVHVKGWFAFCVQPMANEDELQQLSNVIKHEL